MVFVKGCISWNKGKSFSEKTKRKMSKAKKGKTIGENNPNWKGGISKKELINNWKKKNKYRVYYLNRRRWVQKMGALGSHTFKEWEELKTKYKHQCLSCRREEPKIIITQDHITPISKGGSDNIDNIQPLCRSCNSKKSTKIISYLC